MEAATFAQSLDTPPVGADCIERHFDTIQEMQWLLLNETSAIWT